MPRSSNQLREFAIIGARARVKELRDEIASIHRDFPELRTSGAGVASLSINEPGQNEAVAQDSEVKPRRRRRMSAAARKKISDAQKKRWVKQRAAK